MTEGVPLIIPEVNADHLNGHKSGKGGIIANPNCSTIIALMAVTPIHRAAGVKRMVVSTYQVCLSPTSALDSCKVNARVTWLVWEHLHVLWALAWLLCGLLENGRLLWQQILRSLPLRARGAQ